MKKMYYNYKNKIIIINIIKRYNINIKDNIHTYIIIIY